MSNVAKSNSSPITRSQALNILGLSEPLPDDDVRDRVEELIFPVKQFLLMQVPIGLVWKKRMAKLEQWVEAENALFMSNSENKNFAEEEEFQIFNYSAQKSAAQLLLSSAKTATAAAFAAKRLLALEEHYNAWVFKKGQELELALSKDPPKAADKRAIHGVIASLKEPNFELRSSVDFKHEFERVAKLRALHQPKVFIPKDSKK